MNWVMAASRSTAMVSLIWATAASRSWAITSGRPSNAVAYRSVTLATWVALAMSSCISVAAARS